MIPEVLQELLMKCMVSIMQERGLELRFRMIIVEVADVVVEEVEDEDVAEDVMMVLQEVEVLLVVEEEEETEEDHHMKVVVLQVPHPPMTERGITKEKDASLHLQDKGHLVVTQVGLWEIIPEEALLLESQEVLQEAVPHQEDIQENVLLQEDQCVTVMVLQGDHQEVIQEIDLHQGDLQGMVLHLIEDPTEVVDLVVDHLQETMVVQDQGLLMKSIQGEEGTDMRMHMKENEDLRMRLSRDRLKDIGAEVLCQENHQVTQESMGWNCRKFSHS